MTESKKCPKDHGKWGTLLAREPWIGGVAKNFISGHKLYRPSLLRSHLKQPIPCSSATRSPRTCVFTSLPSSSMIPTHYMSYHHWFLNLIMSTTHGLKVLHTIVFVRTSMLMKKQIVSYKQFGISPSGKGHLKG
jgi:hypothetical protein